MREVTGSNAVLTHLAGGTAMHLRTHPLPRLPLPVPLHACAHAGGNGCYSAFVLRKCAVAPRRAAVLVA